jgi:hypothetical protein
MDIPVSLCSAATISNSTGLTTEQSQEGPQQVEALNAFCMRIASKSDQIVLEFVQAWTTLNFTAVLLVSHSDGARRTEHGFVCTVKLFPGNRATPEMRKHSPTAAGNAKMAASTASST